MTAEKESFLMIAGHSVSITQIAATEFNQKKRCSVTKENFIISKANQNTVRNL